MASEVDRPPHYTSHPSGVECIQVTEHMNFNLGNAVKYIWRAALKGKEKQDLEKAIWYLQRELKRGSMAADNFTRRQDVTGCKAKRKVRQERKGRRQAQKAARTKS